MATERIEQNSLEFTGGGQVADTPIFLDPHERLNSQSIARGRIAREVLDALKNSPQWYFVNQRNKQLISEILQESQGLGQRDEELPNGKLPQLRVDTAILHIRQAMSAMQPHDNQDTQEKRVYQAEHTENDNGNRNGAMEPTVLRPVVTILEQPEPRQKRKYTRRPKESLETIEEVAENNLEEKNNEELLALIHQSRLARNILLDLTKSPGFRKLNEQERMKALQACQDSQDLRGYVLLPTSKTRGVSIKEAVTQIVAGLDAQRELSRRLSTEARLKFEAEYPDNIELFDLPIAQAVERAVREARSTQALGQILAEKLEISSKEAVKQAKTLKKSEQETELLKQYANLVHKTVNGLSHRLHNAGIDYEDAVQECNLMLIAAQKSYDPNKGRNLLSYLHTRIHGRLLDMIRISLPPSRTEQRNSILIEEFESSFGLEQGRNPTLDEVRLATGLTADAITKAKNKPREISGEIVFPGDNRTILSTIEDDDPLSSPEELLLLKEEMSEMGAGLSAAFAILSPREKRLITAYYAENKPWHIAASEIGISESHAVQTHKRIITKMQSFLAGTYKPEPLPQPKSLRDFLKELGLSNWTFRNRKLAEGLKLKRGKGRLVIVGPHQQVAVKRRLEKQKQEEANRKAERTKGEATNNDLKKSEWLQIKRILEAIPGLETVEPEQFTALVSNKEKTVSEKISLALRPLTDLEKEIIVLRLSLVPLPIIAKRFKTTPEKVKSIENTAIDGIKHIKSILKLPSGEIIQFK